MTQCVQSSSLGERFCATFFLSSMEDDDIHSIWDIFIIVITLERQQADCHYYYYVAIVILLLLIRLLFLLILSLSLFLVGDSLSCMPQQGQNIPL